MESKQMIELIKITTEMLLKLSELEDFDIGVDPVSKTIYIVNNKNNTEITINELTYSVSEAIKMDDVLRKEYYSETKN